MKVYNEVVIDIESGEVIREDSYEYSGPVILLGGSPGGGGGGGSSGKVDYPDYMKTKHGIWLDALATLIVTATAGGSPFSGDSAYDPSTEVQDMMDEVCWFNDLVHNLDWEADWKTAAGAAKTEIDTIIDASYITNSTNAHAAVLSDQITNEIIPKFESGMLDVNAVYSSAFIVGESIIYAMKNRDVAKFDADLRMKLHLQRNEMISSSISNMMSNWAHVIEAAKDSAHYALEGNRISIVAFKEKVDQDILIEDKDARWDMDVYQYGANMLAAIGGGSVSPGGAEGSKTQSALGGAISGAAAGFMLSGGNPVGAGIGAGIGALLSLF